MVITNGNDLTSSSKLPTASPGGSCVRAGIMKILPEPSRCAALLQKCCCVIYSCLCPASDLQEVLGLFVGICSFSSCRICETQACSYQNRSKFTWVPKFRVDLQAISWSLGLEVEE